MVATTAPVCVFSVTQPEVPPVPSVPGTVPLEPAGQSTAAMVEVTLACAGWGGGGRLEQKTDGVGFSAHQGGEASLTAFPEKPFMTTQPESPSRPVMPFTTPLEPAGQGTRAHVLTYVRRGRRVRVASYAKRRWHP